jgi:hypothetical protein
MQVAVVEAIREAARGLDRGGFVPSSIVEEICRWVFKNRVDPWRVIRAIEFYDPRILKRNPKTGTCTSQRAPKPRDINVNTPRADIITDAQIAELVSRFRSS